MNAVNQEVFGVALRRLSSKPAASACSVRLVDGGKRVPAIVLWFPCSKQIEIGAVQHKDFPVKALLLSSTWARVCRKWRHDV
jgi:hypothetical protein